MNLEERKNVFYRVIAVILLMIPLTFMVLCLIHVFKVLPEGYVLSLIGMILAIAFLGLECFVIIKGGKRENSLSKIVFDENQKINTFPMIAVLVGTALGISITTFSAVLYFTQEEPNKSAMTVTLAIGTYLLINCILYFIYALIFKKRPINLRKFIK